MTGRPGKAPPTPPPPVGLPEVAAARGAGVTLDELVVVGVVAVVLLGDLPPRPPQPTAKTRTAAPPYSTIALLASDLIRLSFLLR
jgi:hypothetical protein